LVAALARDIVGAIPSVASRTEAPATICMDEHRDAVIDMGGTTIFLASKAGILGG